MLATGYTSLIMLGTRYTFRFPNHASKRLHFLNHASSTRLHISLP